MRIAPILLCVLLLACKKKDKRPADVLPPQAMSRVLRQVFLADEWVAVRSERDTSVKAFPSNIALYRGIFRKEAITEEQFRKSLRWYQDHPVELKPVMDSMMKGPLLEVPPLADTMSSGERPFRKRPV
ncbi:DUF4296 domain-containing protein [Flaviaesturariibacter flavus]|uniref:DUF4296 domain-containing protein n=1 Tax=Flaviaesturariibacter flavus TaxID=2502780 RepID=A0A4R1BK77_9BACT|nr:DUF4296 domain-containing protein [Flaviaesturariibacter flavus]TCJ17743.1 DUF4296 domain-containing protein [Flaviaesturariibacter flavus]